MVVHDSAVVRQGLVQLLQADPVFAMQGKKLQWPDVIVLDVEMPRMDGVTFLRQLMHERPTPVIICSTLTEAGAPTSIEALAAGAVAIITKPKVGLKQFLNEAAHELTSAVRSAARVEDGAGDAAHGISLTTDQHRAHQGHRGRAAKLCQGRGCRGNHQIIGAVELVEDSLRMNAGGLTRHGVEVIRDYSCKPLVSIDKHKVLQILVNVVCNAKYACDESELSDKHVTLRVSCLGGSTDRARIPAPRRLSAPSSTLPATWESA
jgi:CheY-like chemotaxis protein